MILLNKKMVYWYGGHFQLAFNIQLGRKFIGSTMKIWAHLHKCVTILYDSGQLLLDRVIKLCREFTHEIIYRWHVINCVFSMLWSSSAAYIYRGKEYTYKVIVIQCNCVPNLYTCWPHWPQARLLRFMMMMAVSLLAYPMWFLATWVYTPGWIGSVYVHVCSSSDFFKPMNNWTCQLMS